MMSSKTPVFLRKSRGILRTIVRQRKKSSWADRCRMRWQPNCVKKYRIWVCTPFVRIKACSVPAGSILITGYFVDIDEGNRLQRDVIGLGMGQSILDSKVRVLAPSPSGYRELIAFDAHADSGDMPGAAVMGPAGAAAGAGTAAVIATNAVAGGIKSYKSASAEEAKKMADKIAAQLSQYFAQQGWIDPGLAQ